MSSARTFVLFAVLASAGCISWPHVQVVKRWSVSFTRFAMLPPACPKNVDCASFERHVATQLRDHGVEFVPAEAVRQRISRRHIDEVMVNLRGTDLHRSNAARLVRGVQGDLGKDLGVDAFIVAVIAEPRDHGRGIEQGFNPGTTSPFDAFTWAVLASAWPLSARKTGPSGPGGEIEIAIIAASTGEVLMHGVGHVRSFWERLCMFCDPPSGTPDMVELNIFARDIIERMFAGGNRFRAIRPQE